MKTYKHKLTIKGVIYEYDAVKIATRKGGIYKSFTRVFGNKRTKEQAVREVLAMRYAYLMWLSGMLPDDITRRES